MKNLNNQGVNKEPVRAAPDGFFRWESARHSAGVSLLKDRAKPVSCHYNNNSFKNPEKSTAKHAYIDTSGEGKRGEKPDHNAPVSVVACYHQSWAFRLWKRDDVTDQVHVPYTCRSWRHPGPCQQFKGRQDFTRIKEGLEKHDGWVYLTLTYAHRRKNVAAVYAKIAKQCQNLRQAIGRIYLRPGEKLKYIALIEQHADGYPHINLLVHSVDFVAAANKNFRSVRRTLGKHVRGTGFGKFHLEPLRSKEAIAGYFSKICGEVAKVNQAPMRAPKNFRRLRSSHDLLPPINKSGEYTGELVQSTVEKAKRHLFPTRYLQDEKDAAEEVVSKEVRAIKWYENIEELHGKFLDMLIPERFHNVKSLGDYFFSNPGCDITKSA